MIYKKSFLSFVIHLSVILFAIDFIKSQKLGTGDEGQSRREVKWTGPPAEEPVLKDTDEEDDEEVVEGGINPRPNTIDPNLMNNVLKSKGPNLSTDINHSIGNGKTESKATDDRSAGFEPWPKNPVQFKEYKYGNSVLIVLVISNIVAIVVLGAVYAYPLSKLFRK